MHEQCAHGPFDHDIAMAEQRGSYVVSVKELCAFTAKTGDLDLRFTPSPTALEGIAGHRTVAARRSAAYQSEVSLNGRFNTLAVKGRADGFDPARVLLEEIKTHRGDLGRVPENHRSLHWAQAQTYAHLKCVEDGLDRIEVAVVYYDIASQTESPFARTYTAAELDALFVDRCTRFEEWAAKQSAHRAARDRALEELQFPHAGFRAGQRELATAVFRTVRDGKCLMAQAPTGIGKTVGALFPSLKAMGQCQLDKVFYLTAKTSGRQLAVDGLRSLALNGIPLRVIELVARNTVCEHPDKECHGDSCPLARGFYDRLAAARESAIVEPFLDRTRVRAVAIEHGICPYYLSQELVRWCDVAIGDYNHYFDSSALLHAMTAANEWRVAILVDEAHNLVDRARAMYSAQLHSHDLRVLCRSAPAPLKRTLKRLNRSWKVLASPQMLGYRVIDKIPTAFIDALESAVVAIGEFQAQSTQPLPPNLLAFFFSATHFARLAEKFDTHSLYDCSLIPAKPSARNSADSWICLRNVIPAPHLAPRLAAAHSVALFSGTLAPAEFYRSLLGLPDESMAIDVESPFAAEQLTVRIARNISTRYVDRARSLPQVADLISSQFDSAPGNYLAFFGSFEYMLQVSDLLARKQPAIPIWLQAPRMDEAAQTAFLDKFSAHGQGIGFAVLGGRFGEGVDLPGRRLIGAFIATLGMPQVNPVNEQMRHLMHAQFGAGYEYAYLYPGLRKVVQAAGRVIRTTSDRGVVHLIDDRFAQPGTLRLLPGWWRVDTHVAGANRYGPPSKTLL